MNFFESELQKIMRCGAPFLDPKYVGEACYGRLDENLRIKLQFVMGDTFQIYTGIKATVINKNDGPVDSTVLWFSDVLGKKQVANPNFPDGVTPHAWTYYGKTTWYVYQPNQQDYQRLCGAISDYCGIFQSQEMGGKGMRMSPQL